ncbi:Cell division protein DivIC (FtsB), stabilizes FtsL against RasP cleavage [hydrothermal vent metagenome]|uniref:Cell division protein DivIC (FtsB), stabilizes FtsL against RasP cleavage n=1 Tax=hydrothermal vent metagenome TaxID=652676 RepID=A0A3B0U961_9ZZZZ
MESIKKVIRNYYLMVGAFLLIWLTFFDSNDLYSQYKLVKKLDNLNADKAYYLDKIEEVKEDREELLSNPDLLEKFAREKYLMKKPTEDLYVVVDIDED